MRSRPSAVPPTLDALRIVLPSYGARFDQTLETAREAIGDSCDPTNPRHAAGIRIWLNKWLCRIRVPAGGEIDPFVDSLATWWTLQAAELPGPQRTLASLDDTELGQIADAYEALVGMTAALKSNGQTRTFGPTATAKVLYFLRPNAVTAWDKAISERLAIRGKGAFRVHLVECRGWAQALVSEAAGRGIQEVDIGPSVGRPTSSVAKLIDEWLYRTITGNVSPETGEPR